jgi:2-dehydro-3-deoxyphosphogluconate aldolase/(4S)-4-hydroxy-2-oxoglutarate aldolase
MSDSAAHRSSNAAAPLRELLYAARIIPVIVIDDETRAVALARTLIRAGLSALEITLRTPEAFRAAQAIARAFPDVVLGVGTVIDTDHVDRADALGARFIVSPGFNPRLVEHANRLELPYLVGVCTPTEIMLALDAGLDTLKFFPAERGGGVRALAEFHGLFPQVAFCPTGGVNAENLARYLEVPNVCAVGGSWLAAAELIRSEDWGAIETRARAAVVAARAARR